MAMDNRAHICDKIFTNGPSKICGRQPLKNLKGYGLRKQKIPKIVLGSFLNILSHILQYKIYLGKVRLETIIESHKFWLFHAVIVLFS